ncbi:hypothetical protein RFI_16725 [Reticulomyxa filosa]|uniref:Uncharacterized protein n=1 Tax=Reticulomyxa filosa TaxID=46433 RepID=X6N3L8_RETFI|nr:hypothetical protein RFI_16725 [Reticulomyxa filosa]|eukprot:ETO20493.1 hypothetical protein RFI_16725 [Reticulomyxa filosa]
MHVMSFKNQTEAKKEITFAVDGNLRSRPNRGEEVTEVKKDMEVDKPKEYKVRLTFVKKISLDDEKTTTEAPSPSVLQGLAILNRSYVSNAGYKKLHPKSDVWFKMTEKEKTSSGGDIHQRGTDMNAPDLRMLNGFHCAPFQGRPKTVLKTIKQCKGVTKYTVRDFIDNNRDWEEKIKGLTAVVMYSTYSFRIYDFDKSKTERSTFMKDGKPISYREYVTRYKKKRQGKENEDEFEYSHFLPSTLMLVPRNEMQTNEARAHLRVRNTVSGEEHIYGAIDFHKDVASSRGNNSFKVLFVFLFISSFCTMLDMFCFVNTQPLRTYGFILNTPSIALIEKSGKQIKIPLDQNFNGGQWGRNIGAVLPPPSVNKKGTDFKSLTIMIFHDKRNEDAKERFLDNWDVFMKQKRQFRVLPFLDPTVKEFSVSELDTLRDKIRNECDMAIVIIPSTEEGSKIKVEITRQVMFRQHYSGLEKSEKWGGHVNPTKDGTNKSANMLNLQFITDHNCANPHSVSSTIESLIFVITNKQINNAITIQFKPNKYEQLIIKK